MDILLVSPKSLQIASWGLLSPDWTISTARQALAPTGIGHIHKETIALRKKVGRMFWLKALLYFGVGINLLNTMFRAYDMKNNPTNYPDDTNLWDKTLMGNTIGHKTHLFVGRYKSGEERYIRWGKQFREFPEMLYDDTGFSPVTASLKKIGGKTAPLAQLGSVIATGHSPSGYRNRDVAETKGWDKTWALAKVIMKTPFPFSIRSIFQKDKDFYITDLAFPSSKGMSRYKAINLFKVALESKDERLLKEVWQNAVRNNIPPYEMFDTALTVLKAENTKDINSSIRNLADVEKALGESPDDKTRIILTRKKARLTKEKVQIENGGKFLEKAIKKFRMETVE